MGQTVATMLKPTGEQTPLVVTSADQHLSTGEILLCKSLKTRNQKLSKKLREEAYEHFRTADILANGPYKECVF